MCMYMYLSVCFCIYLAGLVCVSSCVGVFMSVHVWGSHVYVYVCIYVSVIVFDSYLYLFVDWFNYVY